MQLSNSICLFDVLDLKEFSNKMGRFYKDIQMVETFSHIIYFSLIKVKASLIFTQSVDKLYEANFVIFFQRF